MAQIVSVQCPLCGAPVEVAPSATQVECAYCQRTSAISQEGGTPGGLQTIQPLSQRSSRTAVLFVIVATMAIVGASMVAMVNRQAFGVAGASRLALFTDQPFLFDVNGDGTMDIIGLSEHPGEAAWIAAYDGRDGKELWRTSEQPGDVRSGVRGLAGNLLVTADSLGKVQAYRAQDGQPVWAALVGESAREMCHGDGFLRILTSDDRHHELSLAKGEKLSSPDAPCTSIPVTHTGAGFGYRIVSSLELRTLSFATDIEGMRIDRALIPDGSNTAFLLGHKASGSSVPMLAAVEGQKVLWKVMVPAIDPLRTSTLTTQVAALSAGRIAVPYRLNGTEGIRLSVFDAKTGTRLWDRLVQKKGTSVNQVALSDESVYLSTWSTVHVLRATDGEPRFHVGLGH